MLLHLVLSWAVLAPLQSDDLLAPYRAAAHQRWENEIQALEKLDQEHADPAHAVLFLGSSSIRRWENIASDMAPFPTIRRGYGGAKFSDLAVFIERLVKPHHFDAVAIFVGNDISGSPQDKSPEQVIKLVEYCVAKIREHDSQAPVFLIAITPTPARFAVWDKIRDLNAKLAEYCRGSDHLHYIDTVESYLDQSGKPIADYFVEDRLHQNQAGYTLWAKLIKNELKKVLPTQP